MLVEITPVLCRSARALLDWSQPQLAAASGLGLSTVVDFERQRRLVTSDSISSIRAALETAGVQFLDAGDKASGPGVAINPTT